MARKQRYVIALVERLIYDIDLESVVTLSAVLCIALRVHAAFAWFTDDAIVRNSLPDHSRENPSRGM